MNAIACTKELQDAIDKNPDIAHFNSILEYKDMGLWHHEDHLRELLYAIRVTDNSEAIMHCCSYNTTGSIFGFGFNLYEDGEEMPVFEQRADERTYLTVREFIFGVLKPIATKEQLIKISRNEY